MLKYVKSNFHPFFLLRFVETKTIFMKIEKAYFVNNETYEVYELSKSKRETLEKAHPKWFTYSRDDNNEELKKVERFFVNYGKKIADQSWGNVFVGLTSDF